MKNFNTEFFNSLFEPLGYFVLNRDINKKTSSIYDLYVKDSDMGIEYFGSFEPVFVKYRENNKKVTELDCYVIQNIDEHISNLAYTPEELITFIKDYNENNRTFPAYCYCPITKPSANLINAFIWYMKKLGFEFPDWRNEVSTYGNVITQSMVMKNMYNETLFRITLYVDRDNVQSGKVIRAIGKGWQMITVEYNGLDDMLAAVNSILEPEILTNAAISMSTHEKMTTNRNYEGLTIKKIDSSFNMYEMNAKHIIKAALQKALDNL